MAGSIACAIFIFSGNTNEISPVQFQSDRYTPQTPINIPASPQFIGPDAQQTDGFEGVAVNPGPDMTQSFCASLQSVPDIVTAFYNNNGGPREKLVVMAIDDNTRDCFGANPVILSNELNKLGITLAVVAVCTPCFEIWNFYRELARQTGGGYMLLEDAPRVLSRVISSVVTGEDTLRQAFLHMNIGNISTAANHPDNVDEQNQTTHGVGDLSFDHGLA